MAWERIGYEVLGSAAASISISVPTPYDFYRVTAYIVNDANGKDIYVRFNGDSGANYVYQRVGATATSVSGVRNAGEDDIMLSGNIASIANANTASIVAVVAKPAATVKAQIVSYTSYNATVIVELTGGEWNNTTDEITSVVLFASSNNFEAGSSFLLEGLSF